MSDLHDKVIGRPTIFNKELARQICDEIACNSMGLNKLCKRNSHWPTARSIYRWLRDDPEFYQQYARAKKWQIETLIDEILEIADDSMYDSQSNVEGKTITDHEHIQRSRLRIDTRKWLASKLVPKVYGDRVVSQVEINDTELQIAIEEVAKLKSNDQQ